MDAIETKTIKDIKDYVKSLDTPDNDVYQQNSLLIMSCFSKAMEFIEVNAKFRQSVVSGSFDVPPVRVRWYGEHIDDIFDGTVIDSDDTYYFVIPDENIDMEIKWRKNECEVLR